MIYFFIGTGAELIKLAPVIAAVKARGVPHFLVASGQNDLRGSELWALAGASGADLVLHEERIPQSATGLAAFLAKTSVTGLVALRRTLSAHASPTPRAVVHGDTVSTLLGATLFSALRVPVHHVEAGLRSHRFTEPFPEEICRVLVSKLARVAYCPNAWARDNLAGLSLRTVVTHGNTLYDALGLALGANDSAHEPKESPEDADTNGATNVLAGNLDPFFLLVVHRQENLMGARFLARVLDEVRASMGARRCVFLMHALTRAALERQGSFEELARDARFVLLPRQPYVPFMRIVARADLLITDGGSNQEEAYYLGKPCLLLRRSTERTEGLGENVLLSDDPIAEIAGFLRAPARFARPRVTLTTSPSAIIADDLARG